jgi:hypothetical protein
MPRQGTTAAKAALQEALWERFKVRIPEWLRDGADEQDLQHIHGIAEAAWAATHGARHATTLHPIPAQEGPL